MFMRYLGNGIGHRATNHIHFDDVIDSQSSSDSSADSEPGAVEDNSDMDVDELNDSGNDGELEEAISDEDDDYGYNHNRLIHEDDENDGESEEDDDWDSMYTD